MSWKASQADPRTTSTPKTKSDSAGCEICPSAGSNFCICQLIFANVITAHGGELPKDMTFESFVVSE